MKAGVAGAGLMGAEIARVFALAGHHVLPHDGTDEALAGAFERLRVILEKALRGNLMPPMPQAALGRIEPVRSIERTGWLGANGFELESKR